MVFKQSFLKNSFRIQYYPIATGKVHYQKKKSVLRVTNKFSYNNTRVKFRFTYNRIINQEGFLTKSRRFFNSETRANPLLVESEEERKLLEFYSRLLKQGVPLVIGIGKKPVYPKEDPRGQIRDLDEVKKILTEGRYEIKVELSGTKYMVLDLDTHKCANQSALKDYGIQSRLMRVLRDRAYNSIMVSTPRGGYHLWFQTELKPSKNIIDTPIKALFPHCDLLVNSGIVGPNMNDRAIIWFPSDLMEDPFRKLDQIPDLLTPISLKDGAKKIQGLLEKLLPTNWPDCTLEGFRRRTALALLKVNSNIEVQTLLDLNLYFFRPPKALKEFENEVLDQIPKIKKTSSSERNKEEGTSFFSLNLNNLIVNKDNGGYYHWNEKKGIWEAVDLDFIKTRSGLDPINFKWKHSDLVSYLRATIGVSLKEKRQQVAEHEKLLLAFEDGYFWINLKNGVLFPFDKKKNISKKDYFVTTQMSLCSVEYELRIGKHGHLDFDKKLDLLVSWFPEAKKFLATGLDIRSKGLLKIHLRAFFCIAALLFLKGLDSDLDLNLQKLIVLTGFGGTGKSTAVQWLKSFLNQDLTHIGAVENLTRPFESSAFPKKKLLVFNEVPFNNKSNSIQTLNKLLNLSGDREIRGEEKYGEIFNFMVEFLVVMNSNFKLKADSIEHYVALKRRVIDFTFDKFIRVPDENLAARLEAEVLKNKELILLFLPEVKNIKNFFNKLDLEYLNVSYAEYRNMDRKVDPYFSFLCEVIRERRPSDSSSPMTISQLSAFFVQYTRQRPDSRIPILDLEAWKEFYNYGILDPFPGLPRDLDNDVHLPLTELPELQWLEPFMRSSDAQREALFNSRAVWVQGLNGMSLRRCILKRTVKNPKYNPFVKESKKNPKEKVIHVQSNLVTNWVIKEDYLMANPDFIIPSTWNPKFTWKDTRFSLERLFNFKNKVKASNTNIVVYQPRAENPTASGNPIYINPTKVLKETPAIKFKTPTEATEAVLNEPVIKRGRGRPKGSTKVKEAEILLDDPVIKRGRGRPKGSTKVKEAEILLDEPVIKRGRGRPKGSTKVKEAETLLDEPVIKRGRGRPKGSTKIKEAEILLDEPVIKRGRGRPKGSTNKPKETQTIVEEPQGKRARGGPKSSNSKALHKNIGWYGDLKKSAGKAMLAPKPNICGLDTGRRAFSTSKEPFLRESAIFLLHNSYIISKIQEECNTKRLEILQQEILRLETKQFPPVSNNPRKNQFLLELGTGNILSNINDIPTIWQKLENRLITNLGPPIGKFVFKEFINCLFYQRINFEFGKVSTKLRFVLKPFINHLWVVLTAANFEDQIQDYKISLEKLIEEEINDIIEEKTRLKSEEKGKPDYKESLKKLNSQLAKKRKLKTKTAGHYEDIQRLVAKIIETFLNELEQLKGKASLTPVNDLRLNSHVKRSISWGENEIFTLLCTVSKLNDKPMIVKPNPWIISEGSKKNKLPEKGGYLSNDFLGTYFFLSTKPDVVRSTAIWDKTYIDKINLIQSLPSFFCLKGLKMLVSGTVERLLPKLKIALLNLKKKRLESTILEDDKELAFKNPELVKKKWCELYREKSGLNHDINSMLGELLEIVYLVRDLSLISSYGLNTEADKLKLYFPLHVCSSLRMYNWGSVNLVNSKKFRWLAAPKEDLHTEFDPLRDQAYRFYLTVQKEKVKGLNNALTKKELQVLNKEPIENFRDYSKFTFYKEKYLSNTPFLLWVDATASVMQIYALLFGDLEIAKGSNLLGGNYSDVYPLIIDTIPKPENYDTWTEPMKKLLQDRAFIKKEIMYYFYGSVKWAALNRIRETEDILTTAQASELINYIRNYLDKRFQVAFELKTILTGVLKELKKTDQCLTWMLQGNLLNFKVVRIKQQRFRIKSKLFPSPHNEFTVKTQTNVIDVNKMVRRILTTYFHSTDAEITLKLKVRYFNQTGLSLNSIHDSYSVKAEHYQLLCRLYKEVAKEVAFDKPLITKLKLDCPILKPFREKLEGLDLKIGLSKENKAWKKLTKTTGYPLYPE